MLENVVLSVVAALRERGIEAAPAFPKTPAKAGDGGFVRVGVAGARDRGAGLARYLGVESDMQRGEREVYGLLCDMEISIDVYTPPAGDNAALDALALFDRAAEAVGGMGCLQVKELTCGAPGPDKDTGLFRLSGAAKCRGLLISAEGGEEAVFADYVLRGVLKS